MKHLVIGGPHDGQRIEQPKVDQQIVLLKRDWHAPLRTAEPLPLCDITASQHVYNAVAFASGKAIHWVYVHRSLGDDELMGHLINGYKETAA